MYILINICAYIPLFCQLRRPKNNNTPVAMSTSSTQTLVSNTIIQEKEPKLLGQCELGLVTYFQMGKYGKKEQRE